MGISQQEYDERKARIERGEGTDDDTRLVDLAESEGMKPSGKRDGDVQDTKSDDDGQTERADEGDTVQGRATARGRTAASTRSKP